MRITILGTAALAAVSLFQTGAYAQLVGNITTDIPFNFYVGNNMLQAGKYTITELPDHDMEFRNDKTDKVVLELGTSATSVEPAQDTELIFNRYGATEYIHQIKLKGETEGIEFMPCKAEQKLMDRGPKAMMHSHAAMHHKMAKHS